MITYTKIQRILNNKNLTEYEKDIYLEFLFNFENNIKVKNENNTRTI